MASTAFAVEATFLVWDGVTHREDGSALEDGDLKSYEVCGSTESMGICDQFSVIYLNVSKPEIEIPADKIEASFFRIRAIDSENNLSGWSTEIKGTLNPGTSTSNPKTPNTPWFRFEFRP